MGSATGRAGSCVTVLCAGIDGFSALVAANRDGPSGFFGRLSRSQSRPWLLACLLPSTCELAFSGSCLGDVSFWLTLMLFLPFVPFSVCPVQWGIRSMFKG